MEAVEVQVDVLAHRRERRLRNSSSHLVSCVHRGCLRPLGDTVVYVMIHNSSKLSYEVAMKVLWLEVSTAEEL